MEHYEKKISFLGENIQTIRKHRGMKQQELADKIGINMQSLSKIERGVNYPTFDTLEKIMDVLGVTPNELLSGEWKYIDHTEPYIMDIIKREQDFNVSLVYLSENEFFDNENEYRFYMETILMEQRSLISSCMEDTANKKPSKECKAPPLVARLLTGLFLFCGG